MSKVIDLGKWRKNKQINAEHEPIDEKNISLLLDMLDKIEAKGLVLYRCCCGNIQVFLPVEDHELIAKITCKVCDEKASFEIKA